jgi:hypothetical protein
MTLHRLPRTLPPLATLLADLGNPAPREWARALGVSERTAWRWQAAGKAPRAVALALFWVTRWGWSQIESEALYAVDLLRSTSRAAQAEKMALRAEIERLASIGDYGAANDPTPHAVTRGQAQRLPRPGGDGCAAPAAAVTRLEDQRLQT